MWLVFFLKKIVCFALSETKEALIDQFKCKMQPIECCISTIGDQHINGCYVAEVDVN